MPESLSSDAIKFENQLRELYVDLQLADAPLSLRIGKQQIVWGEADDFRMLDRANALDTSWHYIMEIPPPTFGWDDLRIPFWMIKGLWDIGNIGQLSNVFAEAYWNPGDWRPVKVAYLPRPWGLRIQNPLFNKEDGAFFAPFHAIKTCCAAICSGGAAGAAAGGGDDEDATGATDTAGATEAEGAGVGAVVLSSHATSGTTNASERAKERMSAMLA